MKKILPVLGFLACFSGGVAQAFSGSCSGDAGLATLTSSPANVAPGTSWAGTHTQSTALLTTSGCIDLSCVAQITQLPSMIQLSYDGSVGAPEGTPGAQYDNINSPTHFYLKSSCPVVVTAATSGFSGVPLTSSAGFGFGANTTAGDSASWVALNTSTTPPATPSITATQGNPVTVSPTIPASAGSTTSGVATNGNDMYLFAQTNLPADTSALPSGEYTSTITLTIYQP